MSRSTPQSFLFKITQIESIVRLIKDDFLRDRVIPDLNTVNSVISEMKSLRDFGCNQNIGYTNQMKK